MVLCYSSPEEQIQAPSALSPSPQTTVGEGRGRALHRPRPLLGGHSGPDCLGALDTALSLQGPWEDEDKRGGLPGAGHSTSPSWSPESPGIARPHPSPSSGPLPQPSAGWNGRYLRLHLSRGDTERGTLAWSLHLTNVHWLRLALSGGASRTDCGPTPSSQKGLGSSQEAGREVVGRRPDWQDPEGRAPSLQVLCGGGASPLPPSAGLTQHRWPSAGGPVCQRSAPETLVHFLQSRPDAAGDSGLWDFQVGAQCLPRVGGRKMP